MHQRSFFDFALDKERDRNEGAQRLPRDIAGLAGSSGFEPTRDSWRAYQAWCKQVREQWDDKG